VTSVMIRLLNMQEGRGCGGGDDSGPVAEVQRLLDQL